MAFVINKTEYKSLFSPKSSIPGPGAYQPKQHTQQQSPAPFNASTSKQSCFQVKESNLGPGSYSRTSISECFKSKSTVATTFKSKAARFPYQEKRKSRIPTQPEEKEQEPPRRQKQIRPMSTGSNFREKKLQQKKEYLLELRKRNQERKIASIVSQQKDKVRILLSNPHNTQNVESFYIDDYVKIRKNGTGDYDIRTPIGEKNKGVIDWAKDKQKRFARSKSMIATNPGPGAYELAKKNQKSTKNLSSSFSYGGVRTFIDTIIYKTNNQFKAKILQQKGIAKQSEPGPADYSPDKKMRESFYYGKQIMSSTVERFEINKDKVSIPGPGYYQVAECKQKYGGTVKEIRHKIFGKNGSLVKQNQPDQSFVSLQQEINNLKTETFEITHELVPCTLKERCQSKVGTLSQEPRFKDIKKPKQPGPGQYYSHFEIKSPPEPSHIFKSTTERQPYLIKKDNTSVNFYDVNKEDISIRTKKIKQNIQSLRKVSIQKPAFDSSVARFSSTQNPSTQSEKNIIPQRITTYERDQIDYESFKPYKQKTSYASVFRSTTTREPFVIKDIPGPGSYQQPDRLNKISYNIQYQTSTKPKALSTPKLEIP